MQSRLDIQPRQVSAALARAVAFLLGFRLGSAFAAGAATAGL